MSLRHPKVRRPVCRAEADSQAPRPRSSPRRGEKSRRTTAFVSEDLTWNCSPELRITSYWPTFFSHDQNELPRKLREAVSSWVQLDDVSTSKTQKMLVFERQTDKGREKGEPHLYMVGSILETRATYFISR